MTSIISRPVVAIAGATGHLGSRVASAFLSSPFNEQFSDVILLSRNKPSPESTPKTGGRYTTRKYDEDNLVDALRGVQILVNTVGPSGHSFKEKLLHALPHTDVQVYFPSEFGVDHYVHDFPHSEWNTKKEQFALAQKLIPDRKICRVFCGLFLEDSIGPWFGFDTKNGRYESVGSASSPISFTSLEDVGKVVASLATLPKEKIPDTVHVGGDTRSFHEISEIMRDAGAGPIEVSEVSLQEYKKEVTSTSSWDPARYLRFLMGENKINHSTGALGDDNELVNPNGELWKWESLTDLGRGTGGKPWKDFP
ncbi:uncharacterized protein N7473_002112 [Penicillium subrubescens]|uniref:NmrA-like domain-containing protein n=1 Tax=Penicillium subrubescens TaxID=1316194 RepID=A0A1Q5UFM4_9EURO|nr:uncharacterized protein N7473_002112 [Penicillium subrubescens]KAJ5905196.1 hypothetical protein N7473_002112 [Penicillium subrubescens]OKP11280.1 hypothetical protein PENSUB_3302 [Penicillium subrubescens]